MPILQSFGALSTRGFGAGGTPPPSSQQAYTTPGTYTWVAPVGVRYVCVVCVGAGGKGGAGTAGGDYGSGGGGGLGWKNNIAVVAGNSYTVVVGAGSSTLGANGGDSYFVNTSTVKGGGGF